MHRACAQVRTYITLENCPKVACVVEDYVREWNDAHVEEWHVHLEAWGDLTRLDFARLEELFRGKGAIHLVGGGSPCQDISRANWHKRQHLQGEKSGLVRAT